MTSTILQRKADELQARLRDAPALIVAYSGGVDSAVVAAAAWRGRRHHPAAEANTLAVTAVSPSLPRAEREAARRLAAEIGIPHRELETDELSRPEYAANGAQRCFHCKTELYTVIESRLFSLLPTADPRGVSIVNGANLDDQGDFRPGMQAARQHGVASPLIECGFTKDDVRALAREWGLPVWDKPASPCLSSRIAYGVEVTIDRLARIEAAEEFLRHRLGIRNLRVRCEANELARIELPREQVALAATPEHAGAIDEKLRELGFRAVALDLAGFRSGSLNSLLPLVELSRPPA